MAQTELTPDNIKDVIQTMMVESGAKQKDIYEKIGVNKQTTSRILNGETTPRTDTFVKIANSLGKKVIIK